MPLIKGDNPILDYDDDPAAIIHPAQRLQPDPNMPERVIMPFFQEVIAKRCKDAPVIYTLLSEFANSPIYRLETEFGPVAVLHPGVGSALGSLFMDAAIALGGRIFIACGAAGVLVKHLDKGHVLVPNTAIRDEGASYHYLPPAAEAIAHPAALEAIQHTLAKHHVPYDVGTTWTTDGFYRETRAMVADRVGRGALMVEMEAASLMAVAQFRGVIFGQLLYGGDDVASDEWDPRGWQQDMSSREKLFQLAIESAWAVQ